ncbi:MAG: hypothetical protein CMF49_07725 [Legionellales bacterium]|nr:hypothetical protein [Legionellales bacterium]
MREYQIKKIIFSIFCFMASPIYAYQSSANFLTAPNNNSYYLFANLLYWNVSEAGADNWVQDIGSAGVHQSTTVYGVPFDSDMGLRIGAGFNNASGWDASLYYTGYHTDATDAQTGNLASAYLGNFWVNNTNGASFGPSYQSADMNWDINLDSLDLAFGHEFIVKNIMSMHPFFGLKLASINQDIKTNWYNPINTNNFTQGTEKITNDFNGIGPSVGIDLSFKLLSKTHYALSILGSFSGALMYGHWDLKDVYNNNQPVTKTIDNTDMTNVAPMIDGFLGLQWTGYSTKINTTVRIGYEEQIWYDQLRFYSYNMGRLHDELTLQGGTIDVNFNFK